MGVIACLVEKHRPNTEESSENNEEESHKKLHLAALSVLAPYRDMGIGK